MSDFNWCHGPNCHKHKTQDRIRGVKGSKVLRNRKIAQNNWNANNCWSHFCSQGCWNDFMYKHWDEFIALHPRTEPLETPIEVKQVERQGRDYVYNNGQYEVRPRTYYTKQIVDRPTEN